MNGMSGIYRSRKNNPEVDTQNINGIHLYGPYWPEYAISTVGPVVGELQLKDKNAVDDKIKFMILDTEGDRCYTVCLEGKAARSSVGVNASDGASPPIKEVIIDWLTDYWGDSVAQVKLGYLAEFIEQTAVKMLTEN